VSDSGPITGVADYVWHRMTGDAPVDETGFDPEFNARVFMPVFRPLYHTWFRVRMRGLDQDVTLAVWGEFGRTPKINKDAGRDHWAPVNGVLLAGGGMKTGQAIGATDSTAGYAKDYPVHYHDVLATIYNNLGIDPHAMVQDVAGRPAPILPSTVQPIAKLY